MARLWSPRSKRLIAGEFYDESYSEPSAYESAAKRGRSRPDRASSAPKGGAYIRLARTVINLDDFQPELNAWKDSVNAGIAERRSRGRLGMTVFDNGQQKVGNPREHTLESLTEELQRRCPELFEESPRVPVDGVSIIGHRLEPWLALLFKRGAIHQQEELVRGIIAPELLIDDSHVALHIPHVSLGQIENRDRTRRPEDVTANAERIRAELAPVIPRFVQFAPVEITVADRP